MDLNELTIGQARELSRLFQCGASEGAEPHPFKVGETYIIRTVTFYYTGRLKAVYPNELVIEDASWIADTGRWSTALKEGTLKEVEPFPEEEVIIPRAVIVDCAPWSHALPREVK